MRKIHLVEMPWATLRRALGALGALGAAGLLIAAAPEEQAPPAPSGLIAFFDLSDCPLGWTVAAGAAGRLIAGTVTPAAVGKTVGTPLADQEDRAHRHDYATTLELTARPTSEASGCCDGQGAKQGNYRVAGTAAAATTDLPFLQLVVCRKD